MAHRRLGILGGGQLAMFLCAEATRLGISTTVLADSDDSPARATADRLLIGELDDRVLLDELLDASDVVTFDLEQISSAVLKDLACREAEGHIEVQPKPAVMLRLTDKLEQKRWLKSHGLPTLPFRASDVDTCAEQAAGWFGLPFVQKVRRGGYDGRGVQIIRDRAGLGEFWPTAALVEPCLERPREFAMVAARDVHGSVATYDLVELEFCRRRNVLQTVISPADVGPRLKEVARAIANRTLERLSGAGVFAFEFFLAQNQSLLINEISPRVHNSGHHTLESCQTSQFEQHLRAVCGLPLGDVRQRSAAAVMHNLLAPDDAASGDATAFLPSARPQADTFVHWYGKRRAVPGRKMGHLTALGANPDEARRRADLTFASIVSAGRAA